MPSPDSDAAWRAARRATELDPSFDEGWFALGACARQLGQLEDAIEFLAMARRLAPGNWKAYATYAYCLHQLGRHCEALATLEKVVAVNPSDPEVWRHIAYCHAAAGRYGEALGAVERCIKLDVFNADAQALRAAIVWQGAGDVEEAQKSLRRARLLDSTNGMAQHVADAIASGDPGWIQW